MHNLLKKKLPKFKQANKVNLILLCHKLRELGNVRLPLPFVEGAMRSSTSITTGTTCALPSSADRELALFALISPLLRADFSRPWVPGVFACGAAPASGYGAARAGLSRKSLRWIASTGRRHELHVRAAPVSLAACSGSPEKP